MLGFRKNKTSAATDKPEKTGLFRRLRDGLSRTRHSLTESVVDLVLGSKAIDDDLLEEIETTLLVADMGVEATRDIIDRLTEQVALNQFADADALMAALHKHMQAILAPASQPLVIPEGQRPFVVLMVGINGAGKTTTIGKLAHRFQQQGLKVMLAAGDTFRAAAVEQLQTWGERNEVPVICPAAGRRLGLGHLRCPAVGTGTRCRCPDRGYRRAPAYPVEPDGRTEEDQARHGQARPGRAPRSHAGGGCRHRPERHSTRRRNSTRPSGLTGITLTKLDGTAKGGIIFAIAKKLNIPIRFVGVGEGIENLREFDAKEFVDALFGRCK